MIVRPEPGDERKPGILVADTTPLSLLAEVTGGLDWLFVPGSRVWLPDIIMDEATRDPGDGRDRRMEHRTEIGGWIERNRWRIKRLPTRIGKRYAAEMAAYKRSAELWRLAGRPTGLEPQRPDWKDLGDMSVWHGVHLASAAVEAGEAVIALADDGEVRDVITARGRRLRGAAIDLMGTQTFLEWLVEDFGVQGADTAWETITAARGGKVPTYDKDDPDPVRIRTP